MNLKINDFQSFFFINKYFQNNTRQLQPNVQRIKSIKYKYDFISFEGLSFERLLCGNSETELNCTVGSSIDDINITFHSVQDACSLIDDANIETKVVLDSTSYKSCIGQNACVLTDKKMNMSNSVVDKTWKLLINYNCYRT